MAYSFRPQFGGVLDDFKAKLAEFDALSLKYLAALSGQTALKKRLDLAWSRASVLPKSASRDAALATINAQRAELKRLAGGGVWGPVVDRARRAIEQGRAALAKLKIPGFGLDPITLSVVAASVAVVVLGVTAMTTFLSRDARLRAEIVLAEKKLDALRSGIPADQVAAIDKPRNDKGPLGDLLPDLGELVVPALLVAALFVFGPKLIKGNHS